MNKKTNRIQRFALKKKMPKGIWLQLVYAIQFDGTLACIKLISESLHVPARLDRHDHHKVQCRIQTGGVFDIFVRKGQWVVWNTSILPLKKDLEVGHLVWDDNLFVQSYRRTRKAVK